MQPIYPQSFVPQLVNIEVAFQHYLQVLAEVTTPSSWGWAQLRRKICD